MQNKSLNELPAYTKLAAHFETIKSLHMRDLFSRDASRFDRMHFKLNGLMMDFSKNRILDETITLFAKLAAARNWTQTRDAMFAGGIVNRSENRAALHTALRGSVDPDLIVDGENVRDFVNSVLIKMRVFSDQIRSDKNITDVVNIGIGGSELGARAACEALRARADGPRIHFLANIDPDARADLFARLDPARTLFIVVSKTFTTYETIQNAHAARQWVMAAGVSPSQAFCAVTENTGQAAAFGIPADRLFPLRSWIGGRYGVWSAIGLALMIMIGPDQFDEFLRGAHDMDTHFKTAPFEKNLPCIMAMLDVWYGNFFGFRFRAVLPYAYGLRSLHAHLQQLEMESNGKHVDIDGVPLNYPTIPALFGDQGPNAQHAFMQALHQGSDVVPCDFILCADRPDDLNANALAQARALMFGHDDPARPNRTHPGNRPSTTIILDRLDARNLGILLALYEHKVFTAGVLWGINSFDQWGVERGKIIAREIIENSEKTSQFDESTRGLLRHLRARRPS